MPRPPPPTTPAEALLWAREVIAANPRRAILDTHL
jgi:hypothetical protein